MNKPQSVSIFGATGAVGRDCMSVIAMNSDKFKIKLLSGDNNVERLIELAVRYKPQKVVIANAKHYDRLKEAMQGLQIEVAAGKQALIESAKIPVDRTVMAIAGIAGLEIMMQAIGNCRYLLIATKEAIIAGWPLIRKKARQKKTKLLPMDSEHCSLYQLIGESAEKEVEKLIISASGGPFWQLDKNQQRKVDAKAACRHPNWKMGRKISIDSANLMNKGFEIVEAAYFFDIHIDKIDIVIHRQSVLHAMVYYIDGNVSAGMSCPDMCATIAYCLHYPEHSYIAIPRVDLKQLGSLDFDEVDYERFPAPLLMRSAYRIGRHAVIAVNGANEVAVNAFLQKRIGFLDIYDINARMVDAVSGNLLPSCCETVEDILAIDGLARKRAEELVKQF